MINKINSHKNQVAIQPFSERLTSQSARIAASFKNYLFALPNLFLREKISLRPIDQLRLELHKQVKSEKPINFEEIAEQYKEKIGLRKEDFIQAVRSAVEVLQRRPHQTDRDQKSEKEASISGGKNAAEHPEYVFVNEDELLTRPEFRKTKPDVKKPLSEAIAEYEKDIKEYKTSLSKKLGDLLGQKQDDIQTLLDEKKRKTL